ncbi:MAG: hypothetical protein ACYTA3_03300 [Planctomycetota bacterium]|jgi:hypothetical protein
MAAVERVIRKARRRVTADRAVHGAGWGLFIGAVAGLGVLVVDRAAGPLVPLYTYPVLAGAGLVAFMALSLGRRPGRLATAIRLDRALRLKDRLGTAEAIRRGRARGELALSRSLRSGLRPHTRFVGFAADSIGRCAWTQTALADLACHQAERLAESIDIRPATPIRIRRIWTVAVLLAAVLSAGVAFLPNFASDVAAATTSNTPQLAEQRSEIVGTINDALTDLDRDTLDPASQEELQALDDLARQLSGEPVTETELAEARDESAAQLEQVADRLAEQSRKNLEAVDEVTRRFQGIDVPPEAPQPVEALAEALREGDLEQAADRFDELMDDSESMSPDEREQLAEDLREMGDELETPPGDQELAQRADDIREALEDLGLDEQTARELLEQQDPQEIEQTLREQHVEPESAQQLAEDLERLQEQDQVREQADEQQRRLAEALDDAAEQLEQPEPRDPDTAQPPEAPAEAPQQQPQPPERSPDTPRETEPQPQPGGEQPQETPQRQPGQPQEQPGQPQEAPQQRPGEPSRPQPEPQPAAVPQQRPGPEPEQVPREMPGQTPNQTPPQQVPTAGDETGEPQPERPSVGEALRQLERMRREATENQQDSERLRQAARELADTLSEDEKRELAERWLPKPGASPSAGRTGTGLLEEQPPDGPPPFDRFEDVGGRGPDHRRLARTRRRRRRTGAARPRPGARPQGADGG